MIFRILNNKLLKISFSHNLEDEFINKQKGGSVEFIKVSSSDLPNYEDVNKREFNQLFYKYDDDKNIIIDEDKTVLQWQQDKYKQLENHIYANYSQKKQNQDNGWVTNFTTKLVAGGVTDLDKQVVDLTASFLKGSTLDEVLKDVDDAVKPMYEKLVKVAVKNEWCYQVIQEGKLAIAEDREPVYAEFPKFD